MSAGGPRALLALTLFIAVLAASSLTCQVQKWEPQPRPPMSAQEAEEWAHIRETAVAIHLTQTAVAQILAERAAREAEEAAAAAEEAAEEAAAEASPVHVPVIVNVDFPAAAPLNVQVDGTITFTDARHDVNRISIQAIEGTFPSGSWDPTPDIQWAGYEGRTPFAGKCGRSEFVRAEIKVHDAAGNASEGYTLAFYCQ